MDLDPEKRLTLREAAELCGVSLRSLRRRADRGTLPFSMEGGYRTVRIEDLAAAGLLPTSAPPPPDPLPRPGQGEPGAGPRYGLVRFCRSAESLWELVASGAFEWAGVVDGVFVAGSPPGVATRPAPQAATIAVEAGAEPGRHGLVVRTPYGATELHWYRSAAAAREEFERRVARGRDATPPELVRFELVESGSRVAARTVAGAWQAEQGAQAAVPARPSAQDTVGERPSSAQ